MKLSKVLSEVRKGAIIFQITVVDSSKVYANAKGQLTINPTMFQKKHVKRNVGDEIVKSFTGSKEANVTSLIEHLNQFENLDMIIRVGESAFSGKLQIDE